MIWVILYLVISVAVACEILLRDLHHGRQTVDLGSLLLYVLKGVCWLALPFVYFLPLLDRALSIRLWTRK